MLEGICSSLSDAIGIPFAAFAWGTAPKGSYGVVTVDGEGEALYGDDTLVCQAYSGTVEIVSQTSGEELAAKAQAALIANTDVYAWRFSDSYYDDDVGATHYSWDIEFFAYG